MAETIEQPSDEQQSPYTPNIDEDEGPPPPPINQDAPSLLDNPPPETPAQARALAMPSIDLMRSPALALWFDDAMFNRAVKIAGSLSKAQGIVPRHLIGKPQTCFFVVEQALNWRLSPSFVARNCYETPNGQLGYFGTLCQAVVEASGQIVGGVLYKFEGDWSKVQGKFRIATSAKGSKYPAPTYSEKDEEGLAVVVSAQVKGEVDRREFRIEMRQCFPRNSTLWATDPKTQTCHVAIRRFANMCVPAIFAGVPFDRENDTDMLDVTPPRPLPPAIAAVAPTNGEDKTHTASAPAAPARPKEKAPTAPQEQKPAAETYEVIDHDGVVHTFAKAAEASSVMERLMREGVPRGEAALEGLWESNGHLQTALRERGKAETADMLANLYGACMNGAADLARKAAESAKPAAKAKWEAKPSTYYPVQPTSPCDKAKRGGSWLVWFPWFLEQAGTLKPEEIADFQETFTAELAELKAKKAPDFAKIGEVIAGRRAAAAG